MVEKHRAAQLHGHGAHQMQRQPSADRAQRQLPPPPPHQHSIHHHPPRHAMDVRSMTSAQSNGRYSPSANGASRGPPRPDSLELQRADISRIDAAVISLQALMQDLQQQVQQLRSDVIAREPRSRAPGSDDPTSLDLLSDTVTSISNKAGEIDGIKLNVASLTRRVKILEEQNGTPQTPSLPDASFPRPGSTNQFPPPPPPPSQVPQHAMPARPAQPVQPSQPPPPSEPRAWNAVNIGKRKSPSEADGFELAPNGVPKRPRPLHMASTESLMPHQAGPPPPPPAPPSQSGAPAPPTLAPIRSMSSQSSPHEAWRPEPQRLPPMHSLPNGRDGRPSSGERPVLPGGMAPAPAPPHPPPPQHPHPGAWGEREAWEENRMAAEFYRPMQGGIPVNRGDQRGAMMRRGTGSSGGGGGLQYMDPNMPTKRTRQRPIRNADGILIRKDGKPDQRSISSPQNLRKVHARKMAEQEAIRHGGSPLAHERGSGEDDDDDDDLLSEGESSLSSPVVADDDDDAGHKQVMGKMFPHGVDSPRDGHDLSRRRATQMGNGNGDNGRLPDADDAGSSNASRRSSGSDQSVRHHHHGPMDVDSHPPAADTKSSVAAAAAPPAASEETKPAGFTSANAGHRPASSKDEPKEPGAAAKDAETPKANSPAVGAAAAAAAAAEVDRKE